MLILASSSPRRKELLGSLGIIPKKIISPVVDETPLKGERVLDFIKRIALRKAQEVHTQVPEAFVLAGDTVVVMGGKIIGKPKDRKEAFKVLSQLSGRRHRVYTGICALSPKGKLAYRYVITTISFKRLQEQEIKDYLDSGEWEGRAGAYSIQGKAGKFVKFLSGSYSNVVELPLYETDCLLKGLGFSG